MSGQNRIMTQHADFGYGMLKQGSYKFLQVKFKAFSRLFKTIYPQI